MAITAACGSLRGSLSCLNPTLHSGWLQGASTQLLRRLSTEGGSDEGREQAVGLSAAQMAKALLAGNVRGQFTSIFASPTAPPEPSGSSSGGGCCGGGCGGGQEPQATSSVVHYLSPRGAPPVVLLSPHHHAQHLANLGSLAQASLCTGHLSPPALVQRIRAAGWLPHRVNLLGWLEPIPQAEVRFAWDQARQQLSGSSLADTLPAERLLEGMAGFRMAEVTRAQFVDARGQQHEVDPLEVDAAFLDPLAVGQQDLLLQLLEDPEQRHQLRAFCAAYLGVQVSDALVTEADRFGFTLLGKPAAGASEQAEGEARWRQFRFGFQREMRNREAFSEMWQQMWQEVQEQAGTEEEQRQ